MHIYANIAEQRVKCENEYKYSGENGHCPPPDEVVISVAANTENYSANIDVYMYRIHE